MSEQTPTNRELFLMLQWLQDRLDNLVHHAGGNK